jgi:phosphate:Na+ symporter
MVCSFVGYNPAEGGQVSRLPVVLAMFHTCFNVANTAVLIGPIKQMERIVCWLIPEKQTTKDGAFRLQYIQSGLVQTPEIALLQAQKETAAFAHRVGEMFNMVCQLFIENSDKQFAELFKKIEQEEEATDKTELEIAQYLEHVSNDHLSGDTKHKIRMMMREIGELESIGDACYKLAQIIERKHGTDKTLTQHQTEQLQAMMALCSKSLAQMNVVMSGHRRDHDIHDTYRIETKINEKRRKLRDENAMSVDNQEYSYSLGTLYVDIVNELERLGDYVVNVVQARFS